MKTRIILILLIVLQSCTGTFKGEKKYSRFLLNTYFNITVPDETPEEVIEGVFQLIKKWENVVKSARGKNRLSGDILEIAIGAAEISKITGGAYDPTLFKIFELWGSYNNRWALPEKNRLKEELKKTGYQNISVNNSSIEISESAGFDFGGYAKGWIVDEAVKYLKMNDVSRGIVDGGGDLRVFGAKKWRIGIRNPLEREKIIAVLTLRDKAVATSGNYEKYFFSSGKKYGHILDPSTGYPAEKLESATVIADTCAEADGMATALFVSHENLIEIVEGLNYKTVLIANDLLYVSDGTDISWIDNDKK